MKEIDIEKLKSSTVITIFQQSVQVLTSATIVTLIIFKLLEFEGVLRIIFLPFIAVGLLTLLKGLLELVKAYYCIQLIKKNKNIDYVNTDILEKKYNKLDKISENFKYIVIYFVYSFFSLILLFVQFNIITGEYEDKGSLIAITIFFWLCFVYSFFQTKKILNRK